MPRIGISATGINSYRRGALLGKATAPTPPVGFAFVTDARGNSAADSVGNIALEKAS